MPPHAVSKMATAKTEKGLLILSVRVGAENYSIAKGCMRIESLVSSVVEQPDINTAKIFWNHVCK